MVLCAVFQPRFRKMAPATTKTKTTTTATKKSKQKEHTINRQWIDEQVSILDKAPRVSHKELKALLSACAEMGSLQQQQKVPRRLPALSGVGVGVGVLV